MHHLLGTGASASAGGTSEHSFVGNLNRKKHVLSLETITLFNDGMAGLRVYGGLSRIRRGEALCFLFQLSMQKRGACHNGERRAIVYITMMMSSVPLRRDSAVVQPPPFLLTPYP